MPNIKSAEKNMRKSRAAAVRNRAQRSALRTALKKATDPQATNENRLGAISLLDRGWAFAIAHIRGGDDLGYDWYLQGKAEARWNTFRDFTDAARGLIAAGFTSAGNIAINGGSAGGELMGVVANTDPELWGAVVADVPFVDVLNTMLDAELPLTPGEWPEWGNPITDKAAFDLIRSYSPYDNVAAKPYPPMLITGGLNDPRVTYWEPAKFAAKLRELKTDSNMLLLQTNYSAGHAGASGRYDFLKEVAIDYAFLIDRLCGQVLNPLELQEAAGIIRQDLSVVVQES